MYMYMTLSNLYAHYLSVADVMSSFTQSVYVKLTPFDFIFTLPDSYHIERFLPR